MMRKILLFSTILILSLNIQAQKWVMEYGVAGTYPLWQFKMDGYKSGLGHSLTILSKPFPNYYNWQLQMGGNVNYFWANRTKGNIYYFDDSIYPYRATYKAQNRHAALSFKTRLSSKANPVRFYVDLDLGYRLFIAKEKIVINEYNKEAKYESYLKTNGNFFVGITGGILFRMNRFWYLTLYSRFDYGLNSTWLDLNSVSFSNSSGYTQPNYNNFDYKRTHSTILWTGFSTTFYFGGDGSSKKTRSSGSYSTSPSNTPTPQPKPTPSWDEKAPKIELPNISIPTPNLPKPKPSPVPVPKTPLPKTGPR